MFESLKREAHQACVSDRNTVEGSIHCLSRLSVCLHRYAHQQAARGFPPSSIQLYVYTLQSSGIYRCMDSNSGQSRDSVFTYWLTGLNPPAPAGSSFLSTCLLEVEVEVEVEVGGLGGGLPTPAEANAVTPSPSLLVSKSSHQTVGNGQDNNKSHNHNRIIIIVT